MTAAPAASPFRGARQKGRIHIGSLTSYAVAPPEVISRRNSYMRRLAAALAPKSPGLGPVADGSFDKWWGVYAAIAALRLRFQAEKDAGACSWRLARIALLECWIREQAAPHSATGLGLPIAAYGMPQAKQHHKVAPTFLPIAAE